MNGTLAARIAGLLLLPVALVFATRGVVIAAAALAVGLLVERLLHRPVPLERDRSRRHRTRNLAVGLTTAAAIFLYSFTLGDPTSHLRATRDRSPHSEAEDRRARDVVRAAGEVALGTIALTLVFFGFDRSAQRRARRRRSAAAAAADAPRPIAPA